MNFKSIVFDMDGTLVDSLMVWEVLWKEFGRCYLGGKSFKPSAEDDKAVRTLTLRDAMFLIHKNYGLAESTEQLLDKTNSILINFYTNSVELKKGVKEFLEHCYNNGVKMCIASATAPDLIKMALKHCDIEKYFLGILSCADIGKGKDEPDIYIKACEFLQTDKNETWVFEDSVVAIQTAVKIGMPTVGIYDRHNHSQDIISEISTIYLSHDMDYTNLLP